MGALDNIQKRTLSTIKFSEWKNTWVALILYDFNNVEPIPIKKGMYYPFLGELIEKDNYFELPINQFYIFHVAQNSFENELNKHINKNANYGNDKLDLKFEAKRLTKFELKFKNVEILKNKGTQK